MHQIFLAKKQQLTRGLSWVGARSLGAHASRRKGAVGLGILFAVVGLAPLASALPFNQDMVGNQISVGDMHRPEPAKSKPRGAEERYVGESREAALLMKNPVKPTADSVIHGERLYQVTCSPCHGRYIEDQYVNGGVQHVVPGPPLFEAYMKEKPDAHYFQYIHFGGLAIMPAYGWRFSPEEHWDIVNYIRSVQNRK